jgi:hypothetical protein
MEFEPRVFTYRYSLRGAHYHVDVFSAKSLDHMFARLGTLVMDEHDFNHFKRAFGTDLTTANRRDEDGTGASAL